MALVRLSDDETSAVTSKIGPRTVICQLDLCFLFMYNIPGYQTRTVKGVKQLSHKHTISLQPLYDVITDMSSLVEQHLLLSTVVRLSIISLMYHV